MIGPLSLKSSSWKACRLWVTGNIPRPYVQRTEAHRGTLHRQQRSVNYDTAKRVGINGRPLQEQLTGEEGSGGGY